MSTATFKRHLHELQRGHPGHRFQDRYEREKRKGAGAAKGRWLRIAIAVVALLIGVVLVFIPGPAILFFFLGGGLLAADSLPLARFMDWAELRARAVWRWGRERWKKLPTAGKVALVTIVAVLAIGSAYLLYRWWSS